MLSRMKLRRVVQPTKTRTPSPIESEAESQSAESDDEKDDDYEAEFRGAGFDSEHEPEEELGGDGFGNGKFRGDGFADGNEAEGDAEGFHFKGFGRENEAERGADEEKVHCEGFGRENEAQRGADEEKVHGEGFGRENEAQVGTDEEEFHGGGIIRENRAEGGADEEEYHDGRLGRENGIEGEFHDGGCGGEKGAEGLVEAVCDSESDMERKPAIETRSQRGFQILKGGDEEVDARQNAFSSENNAGKFGEEQEGGCCPLLSGRNVVSSDGLSKEIASGKGGYGEGICNDGHEENQAETRRKAKDEVRKNLFTTEAEKCGNEGRGGHSDGFGRRFAAERGAVVGRRGPRSRGGWKGREAKRNVCSSDEEELYSERSDCGSEGEEEVIDSDHSTDLSYENGNDDEEQDYDPLERTKSANIAALLRGDLIVKRQALLPRVLNVAEGAAVARGAFKSPLGTLHSVTTELQIRLSTLKRFVPWNARELSPPPDHEIFPPLEETKNEDLPPGIEPLILWQEECPIGCTAEPAQIVVDPLLVKFLRAHQREGVQFMFECVAGLREFSKAEDGEAACCGCILADDMGLGKTLQSITLLWTLLRQGFDGNPLAKRVLIVTPTSLVSNWESELIKWLNGRVSVLAVGESSRAEVIAGISKFLSPRNPYQVLIISYETFRLHSVRFQSEGSCDLLICDEAHRLKNDQTLTNQALASLLCRRRVLLSGTPMQNDLEEFFAMVNFTNPGILQSVSAFRKYYENPILTGREPDATDEARSLSAKRSSELSEIVNQFILRRTNSLLSNHLPPKIIQVVCCKLTDLQLKLYRHFIRSKNVRQVLEDKTKRAKVLASITALKKLCNHPKLIYDSLKAGGSQAAGFENCMNYFPQGLFSGRMAAGASIADGSWIEFSGKLAVLARLLANIRQTTNDRIVLVSNYTQTLDLFSQICRERQYPFVRLDGTTSLNKRQKLVQRFNDSEQNEFAFLLSSKAGGCGLNLIGGNRLVLFDPDWNPATDKQAAARVWRDGQKKRVYLYRFLASGTIEEKVYQRQISKEGLQKVVDKEQSSDAKAHVNGISTEDLRDLFNLREDTTSDTHETLGCSRCEQGTDPLKDHEYIDIGKFAEVAGCLDKLQHWEKQIGCPLEEDLKSWAHHADSSTIPDSLLQQAAGGQVTFAFTCQVDGKLAPVESVARSQHCQPPESIRSRLRFNSEQMQAQLLAAPESTLAVRPLTAEHAGVKNGSLATRRVFNNQVSMSPNSLKRTSDSHQVQRISKKPSLTVVDETDDEESEYEDSDDEYFV